MKPMFDISTRDLAAKTILEVGSGRGDTTRVLVNLIKNQPGGRLVATDISDSHFAPLVEEFKGSDVCFICTDAGLLEGIETDSVDLLVCNYTLCAVEARGGGALQALTRFHEVLKLGGELFVEEEWPIEFAETPAQQVWAEKWRILKAALLVAGEHILHEFEPESLGKLALATGLSGVEWEKDTSLFSGLDMLRFFHTRLERLMPRFPNEALRSGFQEWAASLDEKVKLAGGMEIPFYRLHASKGE